MYETRELGETVSCDGATNEKEFTYEAFCLRTSLLRIVMAQGSIPNDVRSCIDAFRAKACLTAIEGLGVVVLLVHDKNWKVRLSKQGRKFIRRATQASRAQAEDDPYREREELVRSWLHIPVTVTNDSPLRNVQAHGKQRIQRHITLRVGVVMSSCLHPYSAP